jgi:hypothetical protein
MDAKRCPYSEEGRKRVIAELERAGLLDGKGHVRQ